MGNSINNEIMSVDWGTFAIVCVVVAIEMTGITEALKSCKWTEKINRALLAFIVCLICGAVNTTIVPPLATAVFDIVFCSFAIGTLGYKGWKGLIEGVPALVLKRAETMMGQQIKS